MDIIFKGRRTDVQERFRQHASAKLSRVEKLDHKAMRIDVEVSQERNPRQADRRERVELTIRSRGPVIRAEAAADDRYAALDLALAKLDARLRRTCERRKTRRGSQLADRWRSLLGLPGGAGEPAGTRPEGGSQAGPAAPDALTEPAVTPGTARADGDGGRGAPGRPPGPAAPDGLIPIEMDGDGPVVVREKYHSAQPMSVDQALAEMELVGHDFYLFRDQGCGYPSVVYRRHGYQYGLIRLVEDAGVREVAWQRGGQA